MSKKNRRRDAANIPTHLAPVLDGTSKETGEKSHTISMTGNQSLFFN
jgi:hypothetical protein